MSKLGKMFELVAIDSLEKSVYYTIIEHEIHKWTK